MKSKFYYLCYQLSSIKLFRRFLIAYYKLGNYFVTRSLKKMKFVESAYLKGSFQTGSFIPAVSDLDYFIIGEKNELNEQKILKAFERIGFFFPFIKDYDFHTKEDADILKNFSGIKFFETHKWKTIKGNDFGFAYRFYPRKFYIDIIHEIYFQFEWLFKNLKLRKGGDHYRSLIIQRQFEKLIALLDYLEEHKEFRVIRKEFVFNKKWTSYSNEEIIKKFNSFVERNRTVRRILEIYSLEFGDREIEEVLENSYYKARLRIINNEFKYEKELDYYFSLDNFKLFYMLGSLDSYIMYDWLTLDRDVLGKLYFQCLYYSRIVENRYNRFHNLDYTKEIYDDVLRSKEIIVKYFSVLEKPAADYMHSNVFLSEFSNSSFTDLLTKILFENQKANIINSHHEYRCLNIILSNTYLSEVDACKNEIDQENIFNLFLQADDKTLIVHQPKQLLELGLHWAFGAKNIILGNSRIVLDEKWFELVNEMLDSKDFVLGYSKVSDKKSILQTNDESEISDLFLWISSFENWMSIKELPYFSSKEYNQLFHYQLTGFLPPVKDAQSVLSDGNRKLFKHKYEIGQVDKEVKYIQADITNIRDEIIKIYQSSLGGIYRNSLGLISVDFIDESFYKLEYAYTHFKNLSRNDQKSQLNILMECGINVGDFIESVRANLKINHFLFEDESLILEEEVNNIKSVEVIYTKSSYGLNVLDKNTYKFQNYLYISYQLDSNCIDQLNFSNNYHLVDNQLHCFLEHESMKQDLLITGKLETNNYIRFEKKPVRKIHFDDEGDFYTKVYEPFYDFDVSGIFKIVAKVSNNQNGYGKYKVFGQEKIFEQRDGLAVFITYANDNTNLELILNSNDHEFIEMSLIKLL